MTVGLFPTKDEKNTSPQAEETQTTQPASTEQAQSIETASEPSAGILPESFPESFMDIQDLKDAFISVWKDGLMGTDLSTIGIGVGILVAFLIFRGLFTRYILNKLHGIAQKTSNPMDDRIVDALIPPIRLVPILLGIYFSFRYIGLNDAMGDVFPSLIKTFAAYLIFWGLYRALQPISLGLEKLKHILTPTMVLWLFKSLRIGTILLGAAVILEIWGIQVGPLLAGLGLFGVAVALGAQDFFKNLIGGVTIIAEKRFQPGEWIKVDGIVEGVVEDVGIRSTQVRQFDKAPVHVPNSKLSDTAIMNYSRMTYRRIYWVIGVEYRTTTEQLKIIRDGIMEYLHDNDDFQKDGVSTFVRIDSFGDSSIDIMIYCFTKTTIWGEWLDIREQLAIVIKEIVEEKAGTAFAFPSQSIYVESLPGGDKPERFIPPDKNSSDTNA